MVGKIKIIFSKEISIQLDEIARILYKKNYFGFLEDAFFYVEKIYYFINENLDKPISKNSPEKFKKYGNKFIKYRANNHTIWYIFFDEKDGNFIVNYILNNHSNDFPELP